MRPSPNVENLGVEPSSKRFPRGALTLVETNYSPYQTPRGETQGGGLLLSDCREPPTGFEPASPTYKDGAKPASATGAACQFVLSSEADTLRLTKHDLT